MDKDGSTDEIAIDETRLLQDGKKKVTFVTDRQPEKRPKGSIGDKRQNDDYTEILKEGLIITVFNFLVKPFQR